jgi:hypothetical protein
VQRGLRHAQAFSWQRAALETHAVYARVNAEASFQASPNDTRNGPARRLADARAK